jgi:hypothetical protein
MFRITFAAAASAFLVRSSAAGRRVVAAPVGDDVDRYAAIEQCRLVTGAEIVEANSLEPQPARM